MIDEELQTRTDRPHFGGSRLGGEEKEAGEGEEGGEAAVIFV
jgi:hypothetical protein